ncbi:MAG: tRNA (adenosine(37)-N6)-threonylcarbamoyltransferase complex ATPase subunit type 1 TsaE [Phycisphaerales bacterium]
MARSTLTISSPSVEQTLFVGHCLGRVLRPGDVLALEGQLGAGKTCLVRGLAQGMGLDDSPVCSPTFVIVNEYTRAAPGHAPATPLVHADAYRLHGPDDLDSVGWERLNDGSAAVVIEWASKVRAALEGEPSLGLVEMEATGDSARVLSLSVPAAWTLRREWPGVAALADGARSRVPTTCRVCARRVMPDARDWPFDSVRCRDADLGRWLSGQYVIGPE